MELAPSRRDALARLLTSLEDQLPAADENTRVRLERDIKGCRQALEWHETRQAGRHHFVWQGGKVIPVFIISTAVPFFAMISIDGRPAPAVIVLAAFVLVGGFGACIAVVYRGWRRAEQRYTDAVTRAERLLAERGGTGRT